MFRKLVSNLPFSPALVGQLGFYARRLKKEQATRRLGLIFTVLALMVQSFAVFNPPEQALATTTSTVIPGGVSSVKEIVDVYDQGGQGRNDFKDLMDYFGVTRDELAHMNQKVVYVCSNDHSIISFGRQHRYSTAEGELTHHVPTKNGFSTFYSVPLYRFDEVNHQTNCYDSYVGESAKVGWFSIMRKCGNFQIKENVRKLPRSHFISASCTAVQGFAYDERQQDQKVKVYLFFGGPPGKGEKYGPIVANQAAPTSPAGKGFGFNFAVPDKYQTSDKPVEVWGVMQPLPGWTEPNVQFDNKVQIPAHCAVEKTPVASCSLLKLNMIERTKYNFTTTATAAQGASIQGYQYAVTDKNGATVFTKTYPSGQLSNTSETVELKNAGAYTVKAVVKTSVGDKQSADCSQVFSVSPPDKCQFNPALAKTDSDCQPCPYDKTIWVKDADCAPTISQAKEAKNLTQNSADANSTTANPGDRIEYTLHTTNVGTAASPATVQENLSDTLEYATVVDTGGGTFDADAKTISWPSLNLAGGQTDARTLILQINDAIASTPRAANDPAAYDCLITNSYGNTINIHMSCPLGKTVEASVKELPATGVTENVIFMAGALMVVTYFYARSRQMNKEVHIIRKDFNTGSL